MPFRKKYNKSQIVTDFWLDQFNSRCLAQLQKMNIEPTDTALPILGTTVLEEPTSVPTYMAKIRAFVRFLLLNPDYDESLVVFYPYTPKGTVTCQEIAVCHFVLSKFREKGEPLKDQQVSIGVFNVW